MSTNVATGGVGAGVGQTITCNLSPYRVQLRQQGEVAIQENVSSYTTSVVGDVARVVAGAVVRNWDVLLLHDSPHRLARDGLGGQMALYCTEVSYGDHKSCTGT